MDQKGFEKMQAAIQWAVDEDRGSSEHLRWQQRTWVTGRITDKVDNLDPDIGMSGLYGMTVFRHEVCATSCCVAGNVVLANGDKFLTWTDSPYSYERGQIAVTWCTDENGERHTISQRARDLMGITAPEAERLFDGTNDVATLVRRGENIAAHYGYELTII